MFNRKKVEKLTLRNIDLTSDYRHVQNKLNLALRDIERYEANINRLREREEQNKNKLQSLISRVAKTFIPDLGVLMALGQSEESALSEFLSRFEKKKKEKAERERIEKIVLELKSRKWELAE